VIYFDHNATSPLSATARDAWLAASERFIGNPSSPHRLGARAELALSEARETAAAHLGCSPFDIVWTSGATEANNALFFHLHKTAPDREVWISAIEHPSVIAAAQLWFGKNVRFLNVTRHGALDLNHLDEQLNRRTPALVMVMAANNETGVLQPWSETFDLCRARGVPFACDAAQWVGKEPSRGLGRCDFVTTSAHKFGGPPGIGLIKAPKSFQPLLVGGPQEDGRRAGTENVPSTLSMIAAWNEREEQIKGAEMKTRLQWRDHFIAELKQRFPEIEIIGEQSPRLWNTVAALMPEALDCRRRWVVQLDKLGFAVSTGSACSSGKEKPSHVLTAMGCDAAKADRMLRFSSGWNTSEQDWRDLLKAIETAAAELRVNRAVP
jgi:cysteine desulfurase